MGVTAIPASTINTLSVIVVTVVISYFTLVLGELVPKRVAMKKSEQIARVICGFISGMSKICKPVIWLLTKSTNGVLRLMHISPERKRKSPRRRSATWWMSARKRAPSKPANGT